MEQLLVFFRGQRLQFDHSRIAATLERPCIIQDERHSSGHPGCKVATGHTEDYHHATRHIFTTVIACPFDHGLRSAVPHGKPLARHSIKIGLALRRSIERSIADQNRLFRTIEDVLGWKDDDLPAGQPLPNVVVGLSLKRKRDAFRQKGSKRLTGRAGKLD